ncbi:MAG: hypothetical protein ACOH1V_00770 [Stenotrophomonas sp.]
MQLIKQNPRVVVASIGGLHDATAGLFYCLKRSIPEALLIAFERCV